ncbi:dolichol phosphate-mannose biosynthesis regulatory protein-domain-containing protein [Cubamyces lactineus]|nr:dolichol phosphate-mannose biosynthesis regulatory protein-domain-containing protein [Cubamyces lactineus]
MALSDRAHGSLLLLLVAFVFLYYTVWTLLLPFLVDSSPVHAWFPSREWAIRIPTLLVVLGLSAIGLFLGACIVRDVNLQAGKRKRGRRSIGPQ